jgi:autotransporter translocation and assembly factor TamB
MHLRNMNVMLRMQKWSAYLYGIETYGVLRQSFREPQVMDFSYATAPTVRAASTSFSKFHFEATDLVLNRFGQYPNAKDTLEFSAHGRLLEGAMVEIAGKLEHIYEKEPGKTSVDMEVDGRNGGLNARLLSKDYFGGGHPAGHITIRGPLAQAKMDWAGRGLPSTLLPVTIDHTMGVLDLDTLDADLTETELHGFGGRAELKGRWNLYTDAIPTMSLAIVDPMDLGHYLPAALARETGTGLTGAVHFSGLSPFAFTFDRIHLQLGRLGIHGSARLLGNLFKTADLTLTLPDAAAQLSGWVDLLGGKVAIDGRAKVGRLDDLLARLGLPALGKSLEISRAQVRGTLTQPVVQASASVLGVPLVPNLATDVTYRRAPGGGRLDVTRLEADPIGGSVSGRGGVTLGPGALRLEDVRVDARHLDLSRVPGTRGLFSGAADLHLAATGPLLHPVGELSLDVPELGLAAHPLGAATAQLGLDAKKGVLIKRLHIGDRAGSLDVKGGLGLDPPRPLDLDVTLDRFRLATLPEGAFARPLELAGEASASLHLGGSLERPTAVGNLGVVGLAVWDTLLGSGQLSLSAQPGGKVRFTGRFFEGKLAVDGTVAVRNLREVDLNARVDFDELELAELFYDTARRLGANAWASGWLEVHTQPALAAELHITRLRADLDSGAGPLPLTIQNHGPITVRYEGASGRVTLVEPIRLASPTGELVVEGSASPAALALHLRGDLQLRLLEPYTRAWLERADGGLVVDVQVGGAMDKPSLDGDVEVKDAVVVPRGQDGELRVPRGHLKLSLAKVDFVGLTFDVDGHQLLLDGSLALEDLRPTRLDALLRGRVAGRLLQMLVPQQITHASGSAALNLVVSGDVKAPSIVGGVTIDSPLDLAPRALRRDVTLKSGVLAVNGSRVVIDERRPLAGSIDEGTFSVRGNAQLNPLRADLGAEITGYVHKIPDTLAVEVSASVRATLEAGELAVSGKLAIIDGRYFKSLHLNKVIQNIVFGERTTVEAEPFWKGSPMLANMALHLEVETKADSFTINNNVGKNVRLSGQLLITGTPPNPHFDGQVTASPDGTLTIPVMPRVQFLVTDGDIVFSPSKDLPSETPTIIVHADAPFVDAAGVEHRVFLELSGNLENLDWNLHTSTGLNKLETISLVTTGRTPDELRAQARGDASRTQTSGGSSLAAAPGASQNALAAVSDELIQELTGDFLSSILQDPLRNLTSFDLTFSLGSDSVRVSAHRALGAILDLNGDYEQSPTWRRGSGNVNLRMADDLVLNAQLWFYKPPVEAEETQTEFRLQLKYHITVP